MTGIIVKNNDRRERAMSRRRFLQAALAAGSVSAIDPKSIFGFDPAHAGPPLGLTENILVLIELDGGNDGLNTVVPYTDATYYARRTSLAIAANTVLPLGDGLGLHPNLPYLKARWDGGDLAVVRGVGHPDGDMSHFSNMAKIQAGTEGSAPTLTGWVGRFLDGRGMDGLAGISVADGGIPLLMKAASAETTGLPSWSGGLFGANRSQASERYTYDTLSLMGAASTGLGTWANAVGGTFRSAIATSQLINPIYSPTIPNTWRLARDLTLVARLINLDVGGRIFHVRLGGFDTHDDQRDDHARLMTEINNGLQAFFNVVQPQFQSRVMVATFSEFGRRLRPNVSVGTDHGAASMLFVMGNRVKGGFYGAQPSLTSLDSRGNIRFNVDMRSVFATLISGWLAGDDRQVFGRTFPKLDMLDPGPSCSPALTHNIQPAATYNAITPARILDTRVGNGAPKAKMAPNSSMDLQVIGAANVPTTVGAVVLNVTVTNPTAGGYLTVWPTGEPRPTASNLNFAPGQTVPNLVLAKLGAGGKVSIYNSAGTTDVIADVNGWFPATNSYKPLTPARILDTRLGTGAPKAKVGPNATLKLGVLNVGGVPGAGVDAVVLNVTAADPSGPSYLTVWPSDQPRPNASNLNMSGGGAVPNMVICRVAPDGTISFYNATGSTHIIADVMGWVPARSGYHALTPMRILDTRTGIGVQGALGNNRSFDVDGLCRGNVPSNARAIVINVTVTGPTGGGYLTVWPAGDPRPTASNLNFTPNQTVPNLVITRVGAQGLVSFYNYGGDSHVIADVMGWFE